MKRQLNTWAPILKENDRPTWSLTVPSGDKPPNQEQYRQLMQEHLDAEIKANPKQAQQDMETMSTSENPDISNIRAQYPTPEWAVQLSQCDQMGMLLGRIDWQKENPVQKSNGEELPNLMDFLQML